MPTIEELGWRQGCFVPPDFLTEQFEDLPDDKRWVGVIVSQDCDLCNPSFDAEPYVEFLLGHIVDAVDRNFQAGKNPRRLHVASTVGPIELLVHNRATADRSRLTEYSAHDHHRLEAKERGVLAKWMGRRYDRPAFPTEFNRRIDADKKKRRALDKSWKLVEPLFDAIYISILPNESQNTEPYNVFVLGLLSPDTDTPDGRAEAIRALEQVRCALDDCDGIQANSSDITSAGEMTIDDSNRLSRLQLDYLTDRKEDLSS